jgi:NAD(P)-dependent dehydrogenase (short-subunit alcohol dehydrogenase family)
MSTSPTLAGRTAVVTGSTSGIGAATAHHLARRGARVVVTGRDADRGRTVAEAITTAGGSAVFVPGDLTSPPALLRELAAAWTTALDGRIDVLVHNAAICPAVDTVSLSDADLEATLAVNVRAPQVLTAAIAPAMVERGSGAIVVVGSWMAVVGHPFVGFYSATKAAEAQLARSWAAEFGPRGVRVNTVAPGATRTPITAGDDDVIIRMTSSTPAGRPGTPDEVAAAIAWLVSDEASYVHGALVPVDGGITATRPV